MSAQQAVQRPWHVDLDRPSRRPQVDQIVVLMVITWSAVVLPRFRTEPHRAQARGVGQRRHPVLIVDRVVEPLADTGRDRLVRGRSSR